MSQPVIPRCIGQKAAPKLRLEPLEILPGQGNPTLKQIGDPSYSRTVAGTLTASKPKLLLKLSGIGEDNHSMAAANTYTTVPSCELNTPDIKFDEILDGKTIYSFSSCNMEVNCEPAHGCPTTLEDDSKSMVLFDLSPLPSVTSPQCDQEDQQDICREEQIMKPQDCIDVASDLSTLMPSTTNTLLCHPHPPLSPSDFLNSHERSSFTQDSGTVNLSAPFLSDALPPQDLENNLEISPEIMEHINKILPHSLDIDELNANTTYLDMFLGNSDDLLNSAMQESGLLDTEMNNGLGRPCEGDASALPQLPTEGAKSVYQGHDTPVNQNSLSIESFLNTSHVTALSQTVGTESVWPLQEPQISSPSVGEFEGLLAPSPCVESLVLPSTPLSSGAAGVAHSNISTVRVTRQRRSSKRPARFRDTVPLDDCLTTDLLGLDLTQESLEPLASTSGYTTSPRKRKKSEALEEPLASTSGYTTSPKRTRQSNTCLSEEEKYRRIRVLNNEASKKCRQKRKESMKDMEGTVVLLEEKNKKLKAKEAALTRLRDRFQSLVHETFTKRLKSNLQNIKD
ncbi:uncharacterized protein LOC121867919 [Homarus americanus]|uniref:uncharacterized protein LOC121867919 n=1 Tax=Homarus americanus TaxID=6706 RepID=UPI001C43B185|nr:uncharacterized protein LOC121867919 [Homarus americanus]